MRKCSRIIIPGFTAFLLTIASMYSTPASAGNLTGGQITYTASNATTGRTDLFLTDSSGKSTENLTESLHIGNINGFCWSPDGTALVFSDDNNIVYRLNPDSDELETLAVDGYDPAWSPTGDTIAYTSIRDGNKEIYLVSDVNLTHSSADEYHPVWTRDGKIIFYSNWEDASTFYLYYMEPDGSNVHYYDSSEMLPAANQARMDIEYSSEIYMQSWSPDWKKMVFARDTSVWGGVTRGEIVIKDIESEVETQVFETEGLNDHPLWSPDGTQIVFRSNRDSYFENSDKVTVYNLYVMNTDGSGQARITNMAANEMIKKAAWRPLKEQTAVSEQNGERPSALSLGPAYPNPFNPSTTITFTLPESGAAHLSVYSVTGQLVRELENGSFSSGEHRVVWDGRDGNGRAVSSGVYFSRLESKGNMATAKITLLR